MAKKFKGTFSPILSKYDSSGMTKRNFVKFTIFRFNGFVLFTTFNFLIRIIFRKNIGA